MSDNPFEQAGNNKQSRMPEPQQDHHDQRSTKDVIKEELGLRSRPKADRGQIIKEELGFGKKDKVAFGSLLKEELGMSSGPKADRGQVIKEELGLGKREAVDRGALLRQSLGLRPKKVKPIEVPDNEGLDSIDPTNLDQERIERTGMSNKTKFKLVAGALLILLIVLAFRLL